MACHVQQHHAISFYLLHPFFSITTDALILKSNWTQHFKFIEIFFHNNFSVYFLFHCISMLLLLCALVLKVNFSFILIIYSQKFLPKTPSILNITTCSNSIKTQLFPLLLSFLFKRESGGIKKMRMELLRYFEFIKTVPRKKTTTKLRRWQKNEHSLLSFKLK